jgi:hypothetical protein
MNKRSRAPDRSGVEYFKENGMRVRTCCLTLAALLGVLVLSGCAGRDNGTGNAADMGSPTAGNAPAPPPVSDPTGSGRTR